MTNEPSQINEDIEILLNNIKTIIDDTDNEEVKKKVNDYIKTVSNNYNITVIGQINSGKSSFINSLIGKDICDVSVVPSTKAVREINCGNTHEELKGLCIYDTPGIGIINSDMSSLSAEYIAKCEMVIFIIPADDPDSSSVWDVLAENKYSPYRRFLFVLQKSDTEDENTLRKIKYDIKTKADKLQISDYTICEVSSLEEELSGDGGFEEIRNSLRSLVCENKNNDKINTIMTELASIISSVQRSLALRKQQYEENLRIAEAVDEIIARFRKNNPAYSFVEDIRESIDNEFETFRKIIVRKLEPSRIKEDFATKDDFRIWFEYIHKEYKDLLNSSIQNSSNTAIKKYINIIDEVFDAANDVLKGRNELIPAEDAFYGKLSKLNDELYRVTCTAIKNTVQFDRELEEASLDLFEELWNAREKNDFIKKTVDITRVIVNTAATSAAVGVTLKAGISSLLAGAALAAPGIGFLLPSLAAIVSVGAIVNIVGSVIENKSGENMEAAARKAIDEFNTRLDEIKSDTIEQTTGYLLETFDRELKIMDKTFRGIRINNNIEEESILCIEDNLSKIDETMQKIREAAEIGI